MRSEGQLCARCVVDPHGSSRLCRTVATAACAIPLQHLRVRRGADSMPEVCTHHVCLEDGVATLQTVEDCNVSEVVKRVEAAGFPAKLVAGAVASNHNTSADKSRPTKERNVDVQELAWSQRNAAAVAAGLLSSSCCLLQLVLNALAMLNVIHVGCAGFNSILGPWRTEMRT